MDKGSNRKNTLPDKFIDLRAKRIIFMTRSWLLQKTKKLFRQIVEFHFF